MYVCVCVYERQRESKCLCVSIHVNICISYTYKSMTMCISMTQNVIVVEWKSEIVFLTASKYFISIYTSLDNASYTNILEGMLAPIENASIIFKTFRIHNGVTINL